MREVVSLGQGLKTAKNKAAIEEAESELSEHTKKAIDTVITQIDDDFRDIPELAERLIETVKYSAMQKIAKETQKIAKMKMIAAGVAFIPVGLANMAAEVVNQYTVKTCITRIADPEDVAFLKEKSLNLGAEKKK